jgi:hypothetical protein
MKKKIFICVTFLCFSNTVMAGCSGDKMSKGWCWPTGTDNIGNYLDFGERNPNYHNRHHLAQDIDANEGDAVYAIADGEVLHARNDVGGYGGLKNCSPTHTDSIPGAGVIIRHKTVDNQEFIALYAHLKNVQVGTTVVAGQKIGEIRNYTACGSRMDHLHFGIRFPNNDDSNRWDGYELGGNYYHFVDPINFLNTHSPRIITWREIKEYAPGWAIPTTIHWWPGDVPCEDAEKWCYYGVCEGNSKSACSLAYNDLIAIKPYKYATEEWIDTFFGTQEEFNSAEQCSN